MITKGEAILSFLKRGNRLTPLDALDRFGCFRLAARISDLRDAGYRIRSDTVQVGGKRVAEYRLLK